MTKPRRRLPCFHAAKITTA